jgi:hypothetical protein
MKTLTKSLLAAALCLILHLIASPVCLAQSFRSATVGDHTMNMLLIQKQGDNTKQFIAKLKGAITGNVSGKIEALDGTIQSLESDDGKASKVTKSELKDGTVVITTEDGQTFVIFDLNSNLVGKIRTGKQTAAQPTAASTNSSKSISETKPNTEKYEEVDATALSIRFEARIKYVENGADGNVVKIDAVVKTLTVAGKPVELTTDKIVQEGKDAFVFTKNLGKIKVVFNSNLEATFWMTASQKKSVTEMAQK